MRSKSFEVNRASTKFFRYIVIALFIIVDPFRPEVSASIAHNLWRYVSR